MLASIALAIYFQLNVSSWWEILLSVVVLIIWYGAAIAWNAFTSDKLLEFEAFSLTTIPTSLFPFIKRGDILTILMIPIYFIVFVVYVTCWIVVAVLLNLANLPFEIIIAIVIRVKLNKETI